MIHLAEIGKIGYSSSERITLLDSETLAISIPARNICCSDELSAGRMTMRQYHRTKVSVRAGRYACGSQKRASVDDTEEWPVIHGPGRSAGSSSDKAVCGSGDRIGALQPEGLARIFPSQQRGRVNFLSELDTIPFDEEGGKIGFREVGREAKRKGRSTAVREVASKPARQSNKSSTRPGVKSCLIFRPCFPARGQLRCYGCLLVKG